MPHTGTVRSSVLTTLCLHVQLQASYTLLHPPPLRKSSPDVPGPARGSSCITAVTGWSAQEAHYRLTAGFRGWQLITQPLTSKTLWWDCTLLICRTTAKPSKRLNGINTAKLGRVKQSIAGLWFNFEGITLSIWQITKNLNTIHCQVWNRFILKCNDDPSLQLWISRQKWGLFCACMHSYESIGVEVQFELSQKDFSVSNIFQPNICFACKSQSVHTHTKE